MASRSRGRQFAVQALYQLDFTKDPLERVLELFWPGVKADSGTRKFTEEIIEGVVGARHELELEITAYLKNWTLDRIVLIDKIILEIAFYELLYSRDIPWRVVIDESVELAKMFTSDKSATFINGVHNAWATKNRSDT